MSDLLFVFTLTGAFLMSAAGVDKVLTSRRVASGGVRAAWTLELLLGFVGTAFLLLQGVLGTEALAVSVAVVLGIVYLGFAVVSEGRARSRPGALCRCSTLLEVHLNRPWSAVTLRAGLLAVSTLSWAAFADKQSPMATSTLYIGIVAAVVFASIMYVLPYATTPVGQFAAFDQMVERQGSVS